MKEQTEILSTLPAQKSIEWFSQETKIRSIIHELIKPCVERCI